MSVIAAATQLDMYLHLLNRMTISYNHCIAQILFFYEIFIKLRYC